jgi:hypothetical protein
MGERTVALTGVGASGLIGDEVPVKALAISGVSAAGAVGTVSIGARLVAITGSQAMGQLGTIGLSYWSLIDDTEDANWQNINTV